MFKTSDYISLIFPWKTTLLKGLGNRALGNLCYQFLQYFVLHNFRLISKVDMELVFLLSYLCFLLFYLHFLLFLLSFFATFIFRGCFRGCQAKRDCGFFKPNHRYKIEIIFFPYDRLHAPLLNPSRIRFNKSPVVLCYSKYSL